MWYIFSDYRPVYLKPMSYISFYLQFSPISSYTIDLRLRILLLFISPTSKVYPISIV